MPIPDFQSLMRPVLAYSADGSEKNIGDCVDALSAEFHLTERRPLQTSCESGKQTIFSNRVHWARSYLDKAGALERTRRSHFRITERGQKLLAQYPQRVDVKVLNQFPEFVAFHSAKSKLETPASGTDIQTAGTDESATPEEAIADALAQIDAKLETDLLARIRENSPTFFEGLVVDLIVAMGYGGSRENVVQQIGKSGDQGIDGIVNEDPLGLDVVYIQAKRYAADQTIGREKIQQFAGALSESDKARPKEYS